MAKTIEEINAKIRSGKAVVFTAEEIIEVVKDVGIKKSGSGSGCGNHRDLQPHVFLGCFFKR